MAKKYNTDDVYSKFMKTEQKIEIPEKEEGNEQSDLETDPAVFEKKKDSGVIEVSLKEEINEHADPETDPSALDKKNTSSVIESSELLIQRSYYLTGELIKAITIKTAEGKHDKSGVIREALKIYLKDILDKI